MSMRDVRLVRGVLCGTYFGQFAIEEDIRDKRRRKVKQLLLLIL
jgi:hypothetical protein